MKIINLTPHEIKEVISGKTFPPSGSVARVSQTIKEIGGEEEIPFYSCEFGDTVDLPLPEHDTVFIVSAMVKNANKLRCDIVSPGELVRDEKGNPIGCKGFFV